MQYAMSTPENSGLLVRLKIQPNYFMSSAENSAKLYIKAENSAANLFITAENSAVTLLFIKSGSSKLSTPEW